MKSVLLDIQSPTFCKNVLICEAVADAFSLTLISRVARLAAEGFNSFAHLRICISGANHGCRCKTGYISFRVEKGRKMRDQIYEK